PVRKRTCQELLCHQLRKRRTDSPAHRRHLGENLFGARESAERRQAPRLPGQRHHQAAWIARLTEGRDAGLGGLECTSGVPVEPYGSHQAPPPAPADHAGLDPVLHAIELLQRLQKLSRSGGTSTPEERLCRDRSTLCPEPGKGAVQRLVLQLL